MPKEHNTKIMGSSSPKGGPFKNVTEELASSIKEKEVDEKLYARTSMNEAAILEIEETKYKLPEPSFVKKGAWEASTFLKEEEMKSVPMKGFDLPEVSEDIKDDNDIKEETIENGDDR